MAPTNQNSPASMADILRAYQAQKTQENPYINFSNSLAQQQQEFNNSDLPWWQKMLGNAAISLGQGYSQGYGQNQVAEEVAQDTGSYADLMQKYMDAAPEDRSSLGRDLAQNEVYQRFGNPLLASQLSDDIEFDNWSRKQDYSGNRELEKVLLQEAVRTGGLDAVNDIEIINTPNGIKISTSKAQPQSTAARGGTLSPDALPTGMRLDDPITAPTLSDLIDQRSLELQRKNRTPPGEAMKAAQRQYAGRSAVQANDAKELQAQQAKVSELASGLNTIEADLAGAGDTGPILGIPNTAWIRDVGANVLSAIIPGEDSQQKKLAKSAALETDVQDLILQKAKELKPVANDERKFLQERLPSRSNTNAENEGIKDAMAAYVKKLGDYVDAKQQWSDARGGDLSGFEKEWRKYDAANPAFSSIVDPETGDTIAQLNESRPDFFSWREETRSSNNSVMDRAPSAIERATIAQESGGNVDAVSPKGAQGAYQVMPATAKAVLEQLGLPPEAYDPRNARQQQMIYNYLNADAAARYDGDPIKVLQDYNAGPEVATGKKPIPKETADYVSSISNRLGLSSEELKKYYRFDPQTGKLIRR